MPKLTKTDDVARQLGFAPAANFVTLNRGTVGFTSGKPQEVEELAFRAIRAGYAISKGLARAAGFSTQRIASIRAAAEL